MHQCAIFPRADIGIQIIKRLQAQDTLGVEGVGISDKLRRVRNTQATRTQCHRRARRRAAPGLCIAFRRIQACRPARGITGGDFDLALAFQEGFKACQPTCWHAWRATTLARAGQHQFARLRCGMEEIRCHATNARFRRGQAKTRAHRAAHPGAGFGCLRPDVFFQRAQDHAIKMLQTRFQ